MCVCVRVLFTLIMFGDICFIVLSKIGTGNASHTCFKGTTHTMDAISVRRFYFPNLDVWRRERAQVTTMDVHCTLNES